MFRFIMNETSFTMKSVYIRWCASQFMIKTCFLITIETTSQGCFDLNQMKHIQDNRFERTLLHNYICIQKEINGL